MKNRLSLWIAVFLVSLAGCRPQENFNARFVYEPLSPIFSQVTVEISGSLDSENNLSEQTDMALTFLSIRGVRSVLQLEGRNGSLYLTRNVAGTDLKKGDRLEAEGLRQVMIATGVVTSGQFKSVDAQELFGLMSALGSGPGAGLPEPVRYRLMESNIEYDYQ